MSPALEAIILARWSGWFGHHGDVSNSFMEFEFQHGDGWYRLLVETFERIEPHVAIWNQGLAKIGTCFEILEVKEKFGELRIIAMPTNRAVYFALLDAREESRTLCELCGAHGELRMNGHMQTLCARCAGERESRG
jgi:hypothetical protein